MYHLTRVSHHGFDGKTDEQIKDIVKEVMTKGVETVDDNGGAARTAIVNGVPYLATYGTNLEGQPRVGSAWEVFEKKTKI